MHPGRVRVRFLLLVGLVVTSAGCRGSVHVRPPVLDLRARASVRVEARPRAPVALDAAEVVEFFGVPLEGAEDVVFVLDCSGSMASFAEGRIASIKAHAQTPTKMQVAQEELADALAKLPEGTRMNVVFFSAGLEALAPEMTPLEEAAREGYIGFVRETVAYGQTALVPAMRTAFLMNPRQIVLLSDGLGNIGGDSDDLLRDAQEAIRGGVRIDTIGIGAGQDAQLLGRLAADSGGVYQAL